MRNILFEISAIDPVTGLTTPIRMSSASSPAEGVYLNGHEWKPAINGGPEFSFNIWGDGVPQPLDVSYGQISFLINQVFTNLDWTKYSWDGSLATVWFGKVGDDFGSYRQIWTGTLGPILRDNDQTAHVALLGPEAPLTRDLLTASYAGTGGAEGPASLIGTLKPYTIGACTNVAPILIDPIYGIYQVHAYGSCAVNTVYENALTLGAPASTVTTFSALAALTLADGTWAACPTLGMFRLANEPAGKITADVGTATTIGSISSTLLQSAGILTAKIDASVSSATGSSCRYATDQMSILEAIRSAAFEARKFLIADGTGKFYLSDLISTKSPGTLTSNRSTYPLVRPDTIKNLVSSPPAWRVKIGHTHVWSKHEIAEISPAIANLGADMSAVEAAAQEAHDAANAAQADANLAKARLATMADDNWLDRTEKLEITQRWTAIAAEQSGLLSKATGLGITTEATALTVAYNALAAYLTGLTPAWYDTTQDTPITRTSFDAAWTNYYDARQALENAADAAAALRADWSSVTGGGKPQDNATRNLVTFGGTAPLGAVQGDIWIDNVRNPPLQYSMWGGVWTVAATTITDTNQVTDGAGLGTKADWINVTGSGRPQDNADVTALSQHSLTIVAPFSVAADYAGTIGAGQLPMVRTPRRMLGVTDVSADADWSISTTPGLSGTLNNTSGDVERGTITLTAMTGTRGTIQVAAQYNSITLYQDIVVVRVDAAQPAGGGGGGGGAPGAPASTSSFTPPGSNTTHQVMSGNLSVVVGGSGQVNLSAPLSFNSSKQGNIDPTSVDITETFLAAKWQCSSTGSGSWSDVGSETIATMGAYHFYQIIVPRDTVQGPGYCPTSASATGLTSGSTAYFRLVGRMDSGTSITSVYGTATATPV